MHAIEPRHRLAQSFGKEDFSLLSVGSIPAVVKLIVANFRDLVFGFHQSLDLPEATSPIPRNDLCSAQAIVEFLLQVYYKK